MKILPFFITLTLFNGVFRLAEASDMNWRTYSLQQFPATNSGCKQTAKELGERFTKATGLEVFRAVCEKETDVFYNIQIIYVSPAPPPFVSTINEEGGLGSQGLYKTLKECENTLTSEVNTFSASTGLTPIVSYCFKDSSTHLTPYFARVDAFGQAKLFPYRYEKTLFASRVDQGPNVISSILKEVAGLGISVHQVIFADEMGLKLVIRYYGSPKEVLFHSQYFRVDEISKFSSFGSKPLENCQNEIPKISKAFVETLTSPVVFFCAWDGMLFNAKLHLLRIQRTEGIRPELAPVRYPSFAECENERPATEIWYEKTLGIKPFFSVCTLKSFFGTGKKDAYVIRVFLKVPLKEELPAWPDLDLDRNRFFNMGGSDD